MHIQEVVLLSGDLASQLDFYSGTLGLPCSMDEAGRLRVEAGGSWLVFEQAPEGWGGYYHFAFNIPENMFSEAKAWLSGRVPLLKDNTGRDEFDFQNWNAHACYFYDPAGNILEFIARHDLPNAWDHPFNAGGILSISEIGLPSDDVPALSRTLQDVVGVQAYKGSESAEFTATGDGDGLFILPKNGRIWLPDTGKPAAPYPLSVAVTVEENRQFRVSGPPYEVSVADA